MTLTRHNKRIALTNLFNLSRQLTKFINESYTVDVSTDSLRQLDVIIRNVAMETQALKTAIWVNIPSDYSLRLTASPTDFEINAALKTWADDVRTDSRWFFDEDERCEFLHEEMTFSFRLADLATELSEIKSDNSSKNFLPASAHTLSDLVNAFQAEIYHSLPELYQSMTSNVASADTLSTAMLYWREDSRADV